MHKLMVHSLTAMLMISYLVDYFFAPELQEEYNAEHDARLEKHALTMALLGYATYLMIIAFCIFSTIYVRFKLEKTWDNVSIRCGFFLVKGAMLATENVGPMLYFCMLLQWYNIALIINHRRDSIPGKSFPIQIFMAYFTMQQYYYRGNHRDLLEAVPFGRVCPGRHESFCTEDVHWILITY